MSIYDLCWGAGRAYDALRLAATHPLYGHEVLLGSTDAATINPTEGATTP